MSSINGPHGARKNAVAEPTVVEADDLVPRMLEHANQNLPDVAVRARDEHAHRRQFHTFQGALPVAQISSRRTLSRSVSIHCQKPACR